MKSTLHFFHVSSFLLISLLSLATLDGLQAQSSTYSTPGSFTFTVPTGVTSITVACWGGGGAGGGAGTTPYAVGGGGSGGGYTIGTFTVTSGTMYNLSVGSGGVSAASPTAATPSWFGSATTIQAVAGGAGGSSLTTTPGTGASAVVSGNVNTGTNITNTYGTAGSTGTYVATQNGGASGIGGNGGNGGAGGAAITGSPTAKAGNPGTAPGGGGSGARTGTGGGLVVGGAGGSGQIIITYPVLSAGTLTAFGNVCVGSMGGPNSFTITGTNLTTANVVVGALSGYSYSTTSGGTYSSSLSLTQSGGAYSQTIYVEFAPTAAQSYAGNIALSSTGADPINVAASGTGVGAPTVTTSATFSAITNTSATGGGTISSCATLSAYGIEYSTVSGFADGSGTSVPGSGYSGTAGGSFTAAITSGTLNPQTEYYIHALATNSNGTGYGSIQSFFTLSNPVISQPSSFTANPGNGTALLTWTTATFPTSGASAGGYLLLYSTGTPSLSSTNGTAPVAGTGTTLVNIPGITTSTSTYDLAGLTNGTTYNYLLIPYTWNGIVADPGTYNYLTTGALTACSLEPNLPGGLALGTAGTTTIPLTITAASPVPTGYVIFYGTSQTTIPAPVNGATLYSGGPYTFGSSSYNAVNGTAAGNYTLTGLTPNTPYYVFVFSYDLNSCSVNYIYSSGYVTASTTTYPNVFYAGTTGNLNNPAKWWSNSDGTTGTNPTNFTIAGVTYNIINQANPTTIANWTVSGTGSVVNIGDGTTSNMPNFTVSGNNNFSAPTVNVLAGSTLTLSTTGTVSISFGTLATTSTVNYASTGAQTVIAANYGNLTLSGARTTNNVTLPTAGTVGISGTFNPSATFSTGGYVVGSSGTGSTVNFNGTGQTIPAFNYYNLSNTNNITLANSGSIGIEGAFTIGGTYTVSGSTVLFNGLSTDPVQYVPLLISSDLSGNASGGYYNLTITSGNSVLMPYTTMAGSGGLGQNIDIYGTLTCSGAGTVVFNYSTVAGNINDYSIGNFTSTSSSGLIDLGSDGGAGTSAIYIYGNFLANGGDLYTASTGNNAIIYFAGTSAAPQQFSCAFSRQVWFYITNGSVVNMTGNVVIGSAVSNYPGYLVVQNGGTLNCGTNIVTSSDASRIKNAFFILQSGGTLGIGSPYGITSNVSIGSVNVGNIQLYADSSATLYRSYSSGANYVYNGVSSQVTGAQFTTNPATTTVNNLYIENAAGVTLSEPISITTGLYIGDVGATNTNITAVSNSIFYDNGNIITPGGSSTLNLGTVPYMAISPITNTSQFVLGSTTTATNYPSFATSNIGAGTTVQYNSGNTVGQTVSATPKYYNLAIVNSSGTGNSTKTLGNNTSVYGALTIGANSTLDASNSGNYGITLGGAWSNSGTFTARNGTVTFNGGATNTQVESTTQIVTPATSSFYTVAHNNSYTVQLAANANTTNTFTNSAGTFNANNFTHTVTGLATVSGGIYQASTALQTFTGGLTVSGGTFTGSTGPVTVGSASVGSAMTLSSGTLTAPSGTFSIYGNWAQTGGTFTPGSNTVTFTLPSTLTPTGNPTGTQTISVGSGGTAVASSAFGSINHSGTGILQIINAPLTTGGAFTNASGAGNFDANTQAHTVTGLASVLGASYLPKTGQQTFNGGLTVSGGTFNGVASSLVSATNVTVASVAGSLLTAPGTTGTFTVSGNWSNASATTFVHNSGTVNFNGSTTQSLASGTAPFYNLTVTASGTVQVVTNPLATTNQFNQSNGIFSANGQTHTVTALANISGGTYNTGIGTQTFNGGLTVSGGTFTGSTGTVSATTVSLSAGTLNAPPSGGTFTVSANWINSGGTFNPLTGTVTFNGTASSYIEGTAASQTFNNISVGIASGNAPTLALGGSGSTTTLSLNTLTITNGSFSPSATGSATTVNVAGNWINNSTFTAGIGTITFNGSGAQAVEGTSSNTFYKLGINNTGSVSNGVTPSATINVGNGTGGGLIMTQGVLNTSTSILLVMNNGTTSSGGSNAPYAFVNGPIKKIGIPASTFMFPVGLVNAGSPAFTGYAGAGIAEATANTTDAFQVQYFHPTGGADNFGWILASQYTTPTAAQGLQRVSSCDYWMINYLTNPTSIPAAATSVTLTYNNAVNQCAGALDYVTNINELTIAHFNNHSGTTNYGYWDNHAYGANLSATGTVGSTGIGSVTWSNVPAFSPFSLGSMTVGDNPLPVLFDYFNAIRATGYNHLTWKAECSNTTAGFSVERSYDGVSFASIHDITIAAVTDCSSPFTYDDYTSSGPRAYYRIRMADLSGNVSYSDIRLVLNAGNAMEILGIRPNPVQNQAWLNISATQSDKVELVLYSVDGKEIQRRTVQVPAGASTVVLETGGLAQGMYIIRGVFSGGQSNTIPFIKQ